MLEGRRSTLGGSRTSSSRSALSAARAALLAACAGWAPAATAPDFVKDIQPILAETCHSCHGPEKQKGGLRLDARHLAMAGGTSGLSIVPGDSAKSYLMARLRGEGDEKRMPEKAPALSAEQISLVAAWIDAGAPWPDSASVAGATLAKHWAYQPPTRPQPPAVRLRAWPRTPIDAFILARLEREGLAPAPPAPPEMQLRRLSLDLIGLPPSPEEVAAFVADRRPDAWERQVDRLLASPHFGERWAQQWLDLARYADTEGFNFDKPRSQWPWRDWVIAAYNADLPFDRFTIEQLAGDLLPGATPAQRIATGFHRNTMVNTEGGVDPEEARWETLLDRANTTAAVWLGSTLACAQCHNHKYDPFSQRDYYAMLAYFDASGEAVHTVSTSTDAAGKEHRTTSLVMAGSRSPAQTHLRVRGGFVSKGEVVAAATPGFLPRLAGASQDRLGLARWLVDPANPLTARVVVNRMWESYFGKGLVETSEDFGTQGSAPSHPELLDWLACEFVAGGWSQKRLHRLIVTSALYRQASRIDPALLERDPYNRLLARFPRARLDAELLRDNALAVSGLLTATVGGPSVFPPAPKDVGRLNTNKESIPWTASTGADRHRRGLYTFWRRTSPFAGLANFDAPSREFCSVRRTRTNTPMQALTALNDPGLWEAAQALGRRLAAAPGPGPAERLAFGFRLCTARAPAPAEARLLAAAFARECAAFAERPEAARSVAGSADAGPELAAYIMLANVLLNLDETITRE